jgi:hypothetical protein
MAKQGRIPKETKEKAKKGKHATYCQKPFTWSFITVNNRRTHGVQRRGVYAGQEKGETLRNGRTVYSIHLCTVFSFIYFIAMSFTKIKVYATGTKKLTSRR